METVNHPHAVQEQYKTPANLNTRISIHTKYSTNPCGFGNWLFSHYQFPPNSRILELGCGTGSLWSNHLHQLDKSLRICLTDFSENMVHTAKKALGEQENITYRVVNIEQIPYEAESFDCVIANMMLYHVADLDKGLCEVRRVLSADGQFYCATYGEHGIMPFIAALFKEYGVKDTTNKIFTLQNGTAILQNYFSKIQRLDYEDSLAVTNLDDLIDYIDSLTTMSEVGALGRTTIKQVLEKEMVDHILHIPKEYGMFLCRK